MKTVTMHISGIPIPLLEKVRSRAAARGATISQYLIDLVRRDLELNDALDRLSRQRLATSRGTRLGRRSAH